MYGFGSYISQYHVGMINKWNTKLRNGELDDDYKKMRNTIYSLFVLLRNGISSRVELIEFFLETIKTHGNVEISGMYDNFRELMDNFFLFQGMHQGDFGEIVGTFYSIYDGNLTDMARNNAYKAIAYILLRYDPKNRYLNSLFAPVKDIGLDEVLLSIYGK
jgi:hypothetical protein